MMADCLEEKYVLTTKLEHFVVTRNAMNHKSIVIHTQTNMLTENCYFLTAYMYNVDNSYFKLGDGHDHRSC